MISAEYSSFRDNRTGERRTVRELHYARKFRLFLPVDGTDRAAGPVGRGATVYAKGGDPKRDRRAHPREAVNQNNREGAAATAGARTEVGPQENAAIWPHRHRIRRLIAVRDGLF